MLYCVLVLSCMLTVLQGSFCDDLEADHLEGTQDLNHFLIYLTDWHTSRKTMDLEVFANILICSLLRMFGARTCAFLTINYLLLIVLVGRTLNNLRVQYYS